MKEEHTPLKVTFTVSGGFVPPPLPLHLDALLAYHVTRQFAGRVANQPDADIAALREIGTRLPLSRHEQEGESCWMASALMPQGEVAIESRFWTQRRDQVDYACAVSRGDIQHGRHPIEINDGERRSAPMKKYAFAIDTLRGVQRNMLQYYAFIKANGEETGRHLEVVCWCVGDRGAIESRLTDGIITHLGQRRRMGHGRIEAVRIEDDPQALENWQLRVKPWALRDDDSAVQAACEAPYWAAENRRIAYCPAALL